MENFIFKKNILFLQKLIDFSSHRTFEFKNLLFSKTLSIS
jgi:hypothetical protein